MDGPVGERRKNTRLEIELEVEVHANNGLIFTGLTTDVSFAGIYIKCNDADMIPLLDSCKVVINLRSGSEVLPISLEGRTVRRSPFGVGIVLVSADLDSYKHLRNLIVINSPDSDLLVKELRGSPGLSTRTEYYRTAN